jgi:hypothetical protein
LPKNRKVILKSRNYKKPVLGQLKNGHLREYHFVKIDLIGPLSIKTKSKHTFVLNALTMIDLETGWFKISEIKERTTEHVAKVFDNVWLS